MTDRADKRNPANRKRDKGTSRRLRLASIAVLGILVWVCVTAWQQSDKLADKQSELNGLKAKLAETQSLNDEAQRDLERLGDKEAMEELARKELHYSNPGETLFSAPKSNP